MKKTGILLLAVLLIFSLFACSGERPAGRTTSQPAASSALSAISSLPAKQSQPAAESTAGKGAGSSQIEEIDSTLQSLKELTGDLDDVTSDDMSIPNP